MSTSRIAGRSAWRGRQARVWGAVALVVTTLATGCGDDDAPAPGTSLGIPDAGEAGMPDAFVGKPRDLPPEREPFEEPEPEPRPTPKPPPDDDDDAGTCDPEACALRGDECLEGICDEDTGACELVPLTDGAPCGSGADTACTDPDTCLDGACVSNHAKMGSACGDTGVECRVDDSCDGEGKCVDGGKQPEGTACGNQTETVCDLADVCDKDGLCKPNYAPSGTPCNPDKLAACGPEDTCNLSGQCTPQGIYRPKSKPFDADACEYGYESGYDRCRCAMEDVNACRPIAGPLCDDNGKDCYFPAGTAWLDPGTPCGSGLECNEYGDCIPPE